MEIKPIDFPIFVQDYLLCVKYVNKNNLLLNDADKNIFFANCIKYIEDNGDDEYMSVK